MIKKYSLIILFASTLILSACHSRRAVMKGEPGEVVAPQPSVAEKYSALMGVEVNSILNGRLYAFIDLWMGTPYRFGGFDHDGKKFSHVGVYLQNGYYVHASSTRGVTITKLHDPYTYKYFSRCGTVM